MPIKPERNFIIEKSKSEGSRVIYMEWLVTREYREVIKEFSRYGNCSGFDSSSVDEINEAELTISRLYDENEVYLHLQDFMKDHYEAIEEK